MRHNIEKHWGRYDNANTNDLYNSNISTNHLDPVPLTSGKFFSTIIQYEKTNYWHIYLDYIWTVVDFRIVHPYGSY